MPSAIIEQAVGAVDGANRTFKVSAMYVPGSLQVWVNGQLKRQDLEDGWTELGNNKFRLNEAPASGSIVQAFFRPV